MEKKTIALIGQGRSGKNIHGAFLRSEANRCFTVKYVVDKDAIARERAKELYPGCEVLADYTELYDRDFDLAVNASYSYQHYPITKDLLLHGKNVLCEKPFAHDYAACDELINLAKKQGVTLAVFQQTFLAPFYLATKEFIRSGKLGRLVQADITYNGLARRWDWQTLQKNMGGSAYNTGPHPIGLALDLLGFDPHAQLIYSKMDTLHTSGDAEDYAKLLLTAPGKMLVDVEISASDCYSPWLLKLQGTCGTYHCTNSKWECKYYVPGENPEQPLVEDTLRNEDHEPVYCREEMKFHEESGEFVGDQFDSAVYNFYTNLYGVLNGTEELRVRPEQARDIVRVIEQAHAQNPLPVKFL